MRKQALLRLFALPVVLSAGVWAASGGGAATASVNRFNTRPVQVAQHPAQPGAPFGVGSNFNITNKTGAQSETTVAVDPTDPAHMLAGVNDLSNFSTFNAIYESTDGGKIWGSAGFSVAAFCYDTWVTFNLAGDAFVGYECSDQRIAYRLAGSTTWVYTKLVNAGSFPDRDMVVVDTTATSPFAGSVYIGFDDNGQSNDSHVMYSRNGQSGWLRSPKINDDAGVNDIGVNAAVGPNGDVYATWEDFAHKQIKTDVSHDGGVTWGTDHVVTNFRINTTTFFISIPPQASRGVLPMPQTTVAPAGSPNAGRLYVTYFDKAVSTANTNTYFRYSDDGGTTWSAEQQVNDDTVNAYHFQPMIAVTPDGTVGISFYDTRNDPGANVKTDRYFSRSTDGGLTWSANLRVSKVSSDETQPGSDFGNQYGDYQGMSGSPNNSFEMVWCDSRPGTKNEDMAGGRAK